MANGIQQQKNAIKKIMQFHNAKLFDFRKECLDESEYDKIIENEKAIEAINAYLNAFEEIACMYNIGAFDKKYAYSQFSAGMIFCHKYFELMINYFRNQDNDELLYIELERLAKEWETKDAKEKKKVLKMRNRLSSKLGKLGK